MKKIRVLIADDHPVVRAGVRTFLENEPDMLVVGEASNACEAIAQVLEHQPDVAVLDISMPGGGLDATRQIRSTCPHTQVLILTFHAQDYYLPLALRSGAQGFVLKSTMDTELINAIRVVAEGGTFLFPSGVKMIVDDYRNLIETRAKAADELLSARERDVIRLIALGYTASEAAAELGLSPKSVEVYRTRIMQKLGVHNRIGLVQYALLHDLLKEDFSEAVA